MKVEILPIDSIKIYWRNPRKFQKEAIKNIAKSIQEYGFNQPIVIDNNNIIVVGHGRYQAANILKMKEVPCIRVNLPEIRANEYRIIDNKTNELSTWDTELLEAELRLFDKEILFDFFNKDEIEFKLETRIKEFNMLKIKENEEYIPVTCIECGTEFLINKKDIQ